MRKILAMTSIRSDYDLMSRLYQLLAAEFRDVRDPLLDALNSAGYMSRPIWTLMHKLPMYGACPRADLGTAEQLEATVINLPSSPRLGR